MEDLLIETLAEFGFPVKLQGSFHESKEYPESFFTFWNSSSRETDFYDNKHTACEYEYDVNFYSSSHDKLYTILESAAEKLKAAGFIITDTGHSVASDKSSHTGRGIEVIYVKNNGGTQI